VVERREHRVQEVVALPDLDGPAGFVLL
jgi:hypothetical protein